MPKSIVGRGLTFPLTITPQGSLSLTQEQDEVEQAIYIILQTAPGERVLRPRFGCYIHELIFEPNTIDTAVKAQRYVQDALAMWEPRIRVTKVVAQPVYHKLSNKEKDRGKNDSYLEIFIEYEIKATKDKRSLVYPFYLIPEE